MLKDMLVKGGPFMYVIFGFSVIALALILEKLYYLYFCELVNFELVKEVVKEHINRKDINGAKTYCLSRKDSLSKLLYVVLDNFGEPKDIIEDKAKECIVSQIALLEKKNWVLGITMNLAPVLGLLGTVTGMIRIFTELSHGGIGRPEVLSGGIGEALLTTAGGLILLIPVTLFYGFINSKIDQIVSEMEKTALEFINIARGY